jgi:hypothetical protein
MTPRHSPHSEGGFYKRFRAGFSPGPAAASYLWMEPSGGRRTPQAFPAGFFPARRAMPERGPPGQNHKKIQKKLKKIVFSPKHA